MNTNSQGLWLLCNRWISDCMCTTKQSRIHHQESVTLEISWPHLRFRGKHIQGRLPDNLAAILGPLPPSLVHLEAQSLMKLSNLNIGDPLPLSLSVYIVAPEFFGLFATHINSKNHKSSSLFFEKQQAAKASLAKTGSTSSKKKKLNVDQAAFQLLEWAEHGDVPEFFKPETQSPVINVTTAEEQIMDETDFEITEEPTTEQAKTLDASMNQGDWVKDLPQAKDPPGLASDITLRSYQRQALHWMVQRELCGESPEQVDEQVQLLSELAKTAAAPTTRPETPVGKQWHCECGPVLVAETTPTTTLAGDPAPSSHHPLWNRRYLVAKSGGKDEVKVFYVHKVLETASAEPPPPPKPCSGGLLCDSMGLGKTVMLMALMLQSKHERKPGGPQGTLVVAKLSLLHQWEEEIRTKTDLTYKVYYGNQTRVVNVDDLQQVDVVLTTYGTLQGQAQQRKEAGPILQCQWLRIVLDEAHCIRNVATLASKVCCQVEARHRWCVSGTIVQNSLDDIYGVLKFLRHEPWCVNGFWKTSITQPMLRNTGDEDGLQLALTRVRRILGPIMIRRTKDSLNSDGTPILSLPPVETKVVHVELSPTEREFYNAVLDRSMQVFDGFVAKGTASTSYIQILAMIQRLRQTCDHISLTVRKRTGIPEDDDVTESIPKGASSPEVTRRFTGRSEVGLGTQFLNDLLAKFCENQPSKKKKKRADTAEESAKRPKDQAYLSQVAQNLSQAVQDNVSHMGEECPICLENCKITEAVVTPCGHTFCRSCLVGHLREKAFSNEAKPKTHFSCPDGPCPSCNYTIEAGRIVAFRPGSDGKLTSSYLTSMKASSTVKPHVRETQEGNSHVVARQILENAIQGSESSKMTAILKELNNVWELDPQSKVLIFSQYLGFLDLLEIQLRAKNIAYLRMDGSLSLKERSKVLDEFSASSKAHSVQQGESNKGTVLVSFHFKVN